MASMRMTSKQQWIELDDSDFILISAMAPHTVNRCTLPSRRGPQQYEKSKIHHQVQELLQGRYILGIFNKNRYCYATFSLNSCAEIQCMEVTTGMAICPKLKVSEVPHHCKGPSTHDAGVILELVPSMSVRLHMVHMMKQRMTARRDWRHWPKSMASSWNLSVWFRSNKSLNFCVSGLFPVSPFVP